MESKLKRLSHILHSYLQTKCWRSFGSRLELEAHQQNLWQKQSNFLTQNSLFYKKYNGLALSEYPLMSKSLMMSEFDKINTKGLTKDKCLDIALKSEESRDFSPMVGEVSVGLSSGTSGNRGLFLADETERARWAGIILAKALPQHILHPQRIALFLRANNNLYTTLSSNKIQFQFFDLLEKLDAHIDRLNIYQPTILVAPPSMLRMLAKSTRLKIYPKRIFSAAEVLDPIDENFLTKRFQQPIHQLYQCTEGFLGASCSHGTIHLNEDYIIIEKEWIDKKNRKFIPIITDLERKTQPIIRYRLNDVLTEKKNPCSCGNPAIAIEQIEGRADDIFYFTSLENKLEPIFPDFLRRRILQADDSIEEYVIKQHSPLKLEVSLFGGNEEKVRAQMTQFFKQQKLQLPDLFFSVYQKPEGLKKMKRVERLFTPESEDLIV